MSYDNTPKTIGDCKPGDEVTTVKDLKVKVIGKSKHRGWYKVESESGRTFELHETCRLKVTR